MVIGYWLRATGYALRVTSYWLLVRSRWSLFSGYELLVGWVGGQNHEHGYCLGSVRCTPKRVEPQSHVHISICGIPSRPCLGQPKQARPQFKQI